MRGSTWSEVVEGDYRLLNWDDNGGTIQQLVGREFRKNDFIQRVPISFIQLPRPISTNWVVKTRDTYSHRSGAQKSKIRCQQSHTPPEGSKGKSNLCLLWLPGLLALLDLQLRCFSV